MKYTVSGTSERNITATHNKVISEINRRDNFVAPRRKELARVEVDRVGELRLPFELGTLFKRGDA